MNLSRRVQSILAVDFGTATTRSSLIDLVDGQYRLVASASTRTTLRDVTIGWAWTIAQIENITQLELTDHQGVLIISDGGGTGIDALVITSSAVRPLTAVVLGLMPNVSIRSARRALSGTYVNVVANLSIADQRDLSAQINTILKANPDLIFVSGGIDGGNEKGVMELVQVAALATKLAPEDEQPIVIFAGNEALTEKVQASFADIPDRLLIANNVRPDLMHEEVGNARLQLTRAFGDYISQQASGFESLQGQSVTPTAQGVSNVVRWLAEVEPDERAVIHLDIGSATSTLVVGMSDNISANIFSELGIGHSLASAVERFNIERLFSRLPFPFTEVALRDYVYNKSLNPDVIPMTPHDLYIEQAIAYEIAQIVKEETLSVVSPKMREAINTPAKIILAGAVLTEGLHHGLMAMQGLDLLSPEGIVELYSDPSVIVPLMGAFAYIEPTATVQVLENQALLNLGTAYCIEGSTRMGRTALKIKLKVDDRVIEHELAMGDIWAAPITIGKQVEVDIRAKRGVTIGGKRRIRQKVVAGLAGIIFDARGRNLAAIPLAQRNERYAAWWQGVTNGQVAYQPVESSELVSAISTLAEVRPQIEKAKQDILQIKAEIERKRREDDEDEDTDRKKRKRNKRRNKRKQKEEEPDLLGKFLS